MHYVELIDADIALVVCGPKIAILVALASIWTPHLDTFGPKVGHN